MMMERIRVLMYSERTDVIHTWLIFFQDIEEVFCANNYDEAETMLTSFIFSIVYIDFSAIDKYQKIADILYQRNLSTKIRVLGETQLNYKGEHHNRQRDKRTKKEPEDDEKAGVKKEDKLIFDELVIDPNSRRVSFKGEEIKLTGIQFDLLLCFATHYDQVLNYDQIFELVWRPEGPTHGDEVVKAHLHRLRKKLSITNREYIENVRGKGYRFSK